MILSRNASGSTLPIMIGRSGAVLALALSLVSAVAFPSQHTPSSDPAPARPIAHATPAKLRQPGGPAEVVDQRTDSSTTYRSPNGSRIVVLSAGPIRTSRSGHWVPINLTLRRGADGGVRPVAAPYTTWLSGGGGTADAAAVRGPTGLSTALAWGARLPAPRLSGNRALYHNARPGVDLLVEVTRTGFVAALLPTGQTSSAGPLTSAVLGPPLTLRDTTPGALGQLLPRLGTIATMSAPAGTLADTPVADRVVASVVHRLSPPLGTTVQNTAPGGDLSGDPNLRIGGLDGGTVSRGFLTWDLSRLRGQKVSQATLRLYGEWAPTCQPQGWQVWSSGPVGPTTRWTNQPAGQRLWATSTATKGYGASCKAGWTNVDLTQLVQSWVRSGASSGTIMLRAADEHSSLGWKRFASGQGPNVPALGVTLAPSDTS
jgi:hypothetical protein